MHDTVRGADCEVRGARCRAACGVKSAPRGAVPSAGCGRYVTGYWQEEARRRTALYMPTRSRRKLAACGSTVLAYCYSKSLLRLRLIRRLTSPSANACAPTHEVVTRLTR